MSLRHPNAAHAVRFFGVLTVLAGCAATPLGPTVQVIPGPGKTFAAFQSDNEMCKNFATGQVKGQADASNQRAVGAAMLGTVLGAATGAAAGSAFGNAGGGAGVGAAAGVGAGTAIGASAGANDQIGIQQQFDNAFSQCMYANGEQVPGFAPVVAIAPVPVAAPPDPMVRATQQELVRLGFLNGGADGYIGPKTRSAIASFESANGMPADGIPSRRLLARLQATSAGAPQSVAAAPPSNWVAPAPSGGTASPASANASAGPGWVSPVKSQ